MVLTDMLCIFPQLQTAVRQTIKTKGGFCISDAIYMFCTYAFKTCAAFHKMPEDRYSNTETPPSVFVKVHVCNDNK